MKINLKFNIEKKYAFLIVGVVLLICGGFFVAANWDVAKTMWHSADDVKVNLKGADYNLTDVVNNKLCLRDGTNCDSGGLAGYSPYYVNFDEDIYGPAINQDNGYGDTCTNQNVSGKFSCDPSETINCTDVFTYLGSYYRRSVSCLVVEVPAKFYTSLPIPECLGEGLVFTINDWCMDDGGAGVGGEGLEVYCHNKIARWCLSDHACPWRTDPTGGETGDTCSRADLDPNTGWMARVTSNGCQKWNGYTNYYCDSNKKAWGTTY